MKLPSLTSNEIMFQIENLGDLNKNIADAEKVKQEIELKIGAAFTRL